MLFLFMYVRICTFSTFSMPFFILYFLFDFIINCICFAQFYRIAIIPAAKVTAASIYATSAVDLILLFGFFHSCLPPQKALHFFMVLCVAFCCKWFILFISNPSSVALKLEKSVFVRVVNTYIFLCANRYYTKQFFYFIFATIYCIFKVYTDELN